MLIENDLLSFCIRPSPPRYTTLRYWRAAANRHSHTNMMLDSQHEQKISDKFLPGSSSFRKESMPLGSSVVGRTWSHCFWTNRLPQTRRMMQLWFLHLIIHYPTNGSSSICVLESILWLKKYDWQWRERKRSLVPCKGISPRGATAPYFARTDADRAILRVDGKEGRSFSMRYRSRWFFDQWIDILLPYWWVSFDEILWTLRVFLFINLQEGEFRRRAWAAPLPKRKSWKFITIIHFPYSGRPSTPSSPQRAVLFIRLDMKSIRLLLVFTTEMLLSMDSSFMIDDDDDRVHALNENHGKWSRDH